MHDCYMKFDYMRSSLTREKYWYMKSVTYWYQFFTRYEELVPILHGVKFTKCEIYGSTMLREVYTDTEVKYFCKYLLFRLCVLIRAFYVIKPYFEIICTVDSRYFDFAYLE